MTCPSCNGNCNQGRDCPERSKMTVLDLLKATAAAENAAMRRACGYPTWIKHDVWIKNGKPRDADERKEARSEEYEKAKIRKNRKKPPSDRG